MYSNMITWQRIWSSLLVLHTVTAFSQKIALTIAPAYPERGQQVTITYHTSQPGAAIKKEAKAVQLVFTYSDMYAVSTKIDMRRQGDDWVTSFTVPRYGTFATFYLQSGDVMDRPAPDKQYELAVYKDKQLVENSCLYKAYSLPEQMGRTPDLAARQAALFEAELKHYPDNYEARIRLLQYKRTAAEKAAEKQKWLDEAHGVIRAKFLSDPGNMGVLNRVTMAYLILGENSRLDSIREVVVREYPHTSAGIELRAALIDKETDTAKRRALLESALKEETDANASVFTDVHEMLFKYYAAHRDSSLALYHARRMIRFKTPYTPLTYKSIAQTLLSVGLALDTARYYAMQALSLADVFPVGIIRYFPETGYLPSYVSDSARSAATALAKGNMLSILGLIALKQGRYAEAERLTGQALASSNDKETLTNAAGVYQFIGKPGKAYEAYWYIQTLEPPDTVSLDSLRNYYVRWKGSPEGFPEQTNALDSLWTRKMTDLLRQQRLNKKLPPLDSLVDMDGLPFPMERLKGKIVIIDFWATWCVPCMREMPYVQRVYDQYKNNPNILFLIVNSGARNTLADAQSWFGRKKYGFPVYYNKDERIGDKLGFSFIPAIYILDGRGFTQFRTIGFEGAIIEKKLEAAIALLLREEF
jgi:thiol-disulfide isomerase/thioredoxin